MPKTVLFLCVANSARSQMAAGMARALAPADVRVMSAGSAPAGVNPLAVQALAELGLDISQQRSKSVDTIDLDAVDTVITLCDEEVCPVVSAGTEQLNWPLPDPAATGGSEEQRLSAFREVRDLLRARIKAWLGAAR